jgi:hypothetical protein
LTFSVAKLIRQSDFSLTANKAAVRATKLLSFGMLLFVFSCVGWALSGGYDNAWVGHFTQMQKSLFVMIAAIALLALITSLKVRNRDNSIEIVSSSHYVS